MSEGNFNVAVEVAMREPHNLRTFSEKSIVWAQNEIAQLRADNRELNARVEAAEAATVELSSVRRGAGAIQYNAIGWPVPTSATIRGSTPPRVTEQDAREIVTDWLSYCCDENFIPDFEWNAPDWRNRLLALLNKLNAVIK